MCAWHGRWRWRRRRAPQRPAAIVRLRQDGQDNLSLTFYRVDDLSGAINGLHPGDAGYQAALQARAYQMTSGGTSIDGPGYGNYEQTGCST